MSGTKSVRSTAPSLVSSTKLVGDVERFLWAASAEADKEHLDAPWVLKLYPTALEASAYFESQYRPRSYGPDEVGQEVQTEEGQLRSKANASRRAAGRLRRYAVGNRLNRFGTLTYAVRHAPSQRRSARTSARSFGTSAMRSADRSHTYGFGNGTRGVTGCMFIFWSVVLFGRS